MKICQYGKRKHPEVFLQKENIKKFLIFLVRKMRNGCEKKLVSIWKFCYFTRGLSMPKSEGENLAPPAS